jgi:hypothetical protein
MLLNAFSWWKVSQIAFIASLVSFGLGTIAFLAGIFSLLYSGFATEAEAKVFEQTARHTAKAA